jgi:hypothetical protein
MPKKRSRTEEYTPRWMTECDVIRYNLRLPDNLKKKLKKEAHKKSMDMSSYICGILSGKIKRPKIK